MSFIHDLYGALGRSATDQPSATVFGDKAEYLSPLDRTVVEGRAAHREHMKRHGVMEAGDMKPGEFSGRENAPMGRAASDIRRAISELRSR